MLIYVRVLCPDFKFRTFFWAAVYVECGTAQGLFECIVAHCEAMDVPIEKICFYASDGASVVSSDRGGLAGLLRAFKPWAGRRAPARGSSFTSGMWKGG